MSKNSKGNTILFLLNDDAILFSFSISYWILKMTQFFSYLVILKEIGLYLFKLTIIDKNTIYI